MSETKLDKLLKVCVSLAVSSVVLVILVIVYSVILQYTNWLNSDTYSSALFFLMGITCYQVLKNNFIFFTLHKRKD